MTFSAFTLLCNHNLQPSTELFSHCTETLCLLSNNSLLSLPLALRKHDSPFYSYEFEYSTYRIWVESYSIFPFVAGFISLSIKSLRFIHVIACVRIPSFLRVNGIPLSVSTTFFLSTHPLMDTWLASSFWLFWITLLTTRVYVYDFIPLHWVLLSVYL